MTKAKRNTTALLAAALLAAALPAQADDQNTNILFGLLAAIGVTLGIVAYQTDYHKQPELKIHDETKDGKKKDGARLQFVPPPPSPGASRPGEMAMAVAFTAKF